MVREDLATPVAGAHGETLTSRISEVVFTADGPVESGIYAMISIRLTLPEDAEGETIFFPVVQTCEDGESGWIEIPTDGQTSNELEMPAPSITVTAPKAESGH